MCSDDTHADHAPIGLPEDLALPLQFDLEPVDSVTITTVIDNLTDAFMPDQGPAHRPPMSARGQLAVTTMQAGEVPDGLLAEHGLSLMVAVIKGGTTHRFLYDAGRSPDGVVHNMACLEIDPSEIEVVVCSHGHFDHTTGLDGLIRRLGGTVSMPVVLHPHFWSRRRVPVPGGGSFELPTTSRRALVGAGFEVVEERRPSFLFDRSVLITGEVPRVTGYEPGFPGQEAWADGRWRADPLVLDDQALIVDVKDKGLVVLTGCGHAGVVNICRYARRLTDGRPLHAVIGGFHLNGPVFEPLIPRVLDDLAVLDPAVIVPAHCTGWRAQHAIGARFKEQFVPNTVGTRFDL